MFLTGIPALSAFKLCLLFIKKMTVLTMRPWWVNSKASSAFVFGLLFFTEMTTRLSRVNSQFRGIIRVYFFPFVLHRDDGDDDVPLAGELKGVIRVYPLPEDPELPLPPRVYNAKALPAKGGCEECVVRIYVVDAEGLQPKDSNGLSDPYIKSVLSYRFT